MSLTGFDSDDDYYSPPEESSPWILEREIGKGGFGLVKLYIHQVIRFETVRTVYSYKPRSVVVRGVGGG